MGIGIEENHIRLSKTIHGKPDMEVSFQYRRAVNPQLPDSRRGVGKPHKDQLAARGGENGFIMNFDYGIFQDEVNGGGVVQSRWNTGDNFPAGGEKANRQNLRDCVQSSA